MKAKIRGGNLIITLRLEGPRPSASGKTLVVASTRGVRRSTIRMGGKAVSINANAFIATDAAMEKKNSKQWRKATE